MKIWLVKQGRGVVESKEYIGIMCSCCKYWGDHRRDFEMAEPGGGQSYPLCVRVFTAVP